MKHRSHADSIQQVTSGACCGGEMILTPNGYAFTMGRRRGSASIGFTAFLKEHEAGSTAAAYRRAGYGPALGLEEQTAAIERFARDHGFASPAVRY